MLAKFAVAAAAIAGAAAFTPMQAPALRQSNVQMNMAIDRRDVLKTAAAAGLALANAGAASAACDNAAKKCTTDQVNKNAAPVITIFDHRGCAEHQNKEYTGAPSNDYNDEMLVKVQSVTLKRDDPKFLDMAKRVDMESKMTFHKSWQKGWAYDSDLNAGATNVHGNEKAAKGNGLF
ncbi:phycoerythrin alpha subunit 15 [Guillardia theta CCMP2712]|uniref:Phycoerythrin alpha subunit 15 n=1 Tax=Guillardia theta (strain CCMP2712) TaxID=905079 RepID=L1I9A0_GUITC|nr:phycoerythrin alpha subunit 15 [Guillardia theta CCMP2712]EKX32484.1 phycoerythrin alpha subunit 15 [Guillardia theta CCMP2712]|eukprot:XP_005819464.1 phycoerythrin alpha subunit 15 [Guillardia theta CCMP2712]